MSEWFFENMMVIGIVLSITIIAVQIYKYVAIKYNLPLPKWIKKID
jgi:Tfp pilus assembly major pilin PilA